MRSYYTYGAVPDPKEAVYGPLSQGFADGGGVEYSMPTDEEERLDEPFVPANQRPALSYFDPGLTTSVTPTGGSYEAGQKLMALSSLIDPTLIKGIGVGDAAFGGAGTSGTPIADYYRAVAPDTVGGRGAFYEEGAIEAAKKAAAQPTKGLYESGFAALAGEPGIEEAIKAKSERDLGAISKVESDYEVMKPISDLLKANKFEQAFDYAKEKGVVDKMMSPGWLEQLRQPFTEQEMKAFYKAIPPDYRGSEYSFNPESAPVSESGYPEPLSAFKSKDKLTAIDAIIRLGGAAVLGAGALSALGGAAGAGAGAAGAGGAGTAGGLTTFAPTAAASQMGALAGTTSAATAAGGAGALSSLGRIAKFIGDIPSIVGEKVAAAFGNQTIGVQSARMLGNAVISGGVTGARGGNLEDILKSAALAAGLTYVSDKAIKAVAENLRGSGVLDAVKDIPGGDITKIDPSIAGNIANNVAQGLDQFTITTFAPSAAVAGLTTTGVLAGTQAALDATEKPEVTVQAEKPVDTVPVVTSPVDAAKPDVTVTTSPEKPEGPPIVTSPVDAAKPDVTVTTSPDKPEGPPVVTSPVDAGKPDVTVTTSPDKPEGPPVVTSPVDAGKPDVTVTTSPDKPEGPPVVTSPVDAGKPEVTVTTSPDKPAVETPPVVVTPPADQKPTDQKPDEKKPDEKKKEEDPLASLISKYGTFENFLKLLGAFGAAGSKTPTPPTATAPAFPSMGGALPKYEIKRTQLSPDIDYYTYGTRPEAKFFEYAQPFTQPVPPVVEPPPADVNPPKEEPVFALGGLTGYAHGGSNDSRYVDGPGSGRDDKIPALLSDGEYVMDAETLALLGDGSTKEGARRMDEFRAKIRQHKGRALSRGRISPNAKSPENYMGGGLA